MPNNRKRRLRPIDFRIRLVAVGRDQSEDLARDYPQVRQLLWPDMLAFIWQRLGRYRHQKTQVDQWDAEGKNIKRLANEYRRSCDDFIEGAIWSCAAGETPDTA
jgi:hypothetical protein